MKIDFKADDSYKARVGEFRIIDVPPRQYLMVDGHGDPNTSQLYVDAIEALYPVAYGLKFFSKGKLESDYVVPPLEGLWWADDPSAFTFDRDKSAWQWTIMILTPDWIRQEHFADAVSAAAVKSSSPALATMRLEMLDEGLCVQTLHVGPYDAEEAVLTEMHERFIPGNGLKMTGEHHEIYLSDPRRVVPARLRTILRQPVARV